MILDCVHEALAGESGGHHVGGIEVGENFDENLKVGGKKFLSDLFFR